MDEIVEISGMYFHQYIAVLATDHPLKSVLELCSAENMQPLLALLSDHPIQAVVDGALDFISTVGRLIDEDELDALMRALKELFIHEQYFPQSKLLFSLIGFASFFQSEERKEKWFALIHDECMAKLESDEIVEYFRSTIERCGFRLGC